MAMWWAGIGAAVAAGVVIARMGRRPDPTEELSELVLRAFGTDWARRLETGEPEIRQALTGDARPELQARIADVTGVIDVKFTRSPEQRRVVAVAALCDYPESRERSRATFDLDWIDTPADVREEMLRTGRGEVFRKWTAGAAAPEAVR